MWANSYTGCAPIYLHSVNCVGTEQKLQDCVLDSDTSEDSHEQDVGALCFNKRESLTYLLAMYFAISLPFF